MNNNIDRITKGLAEACFECVSVAVNDPAAKKEISRGGGSNGGIMTRLLMPRPISNLRISQDALKLCIEHNVLPYDFFILTREQLKKKYGNFFASNKKDVENRHEAGQYLSADHNIPNKAMLDKMFEVFEANPEKCTSKDFRKILNEQSYDLITVEENERLDKAGLKSSGSREKRDSLCSPKIDFTDLWLTPHDVIKKFFDLTKLNKDECLDPCASDGRWLGKKGKSIDILPMVDFVEQKNFLDMTKSDLPKNIKYVVGNLPFSLLDEFVNKSLELVDECYFLVNGDTILNHFNENIKHIYIFSGLEGNQKDNRSRCEFDVPFLIKSALWCCIVHITKEKQKPWDVEKYITNERKRDGFHVALGKNTFIKLDEPVDECERISRIKVVSSISWKGGKSITVEGEKIDLKNFSNI